MDLLARSSAPLVFAALAACSAAETAPPHDPPGATESARFDGPEGTRTYRLFVPSRGDNGPRPLVVMLHGCTQTAEQFAAVSRMNEYADSAGVLVLYPEQPASAHPQRCWNWYDPAHQSRGAGEPALLAAMTRQVIEEQSVDASRVYVAGLSAGGAMALTMAASYPELFAAVASHSGVPYRAAGTVGEALVAMRDGAAEMPGGGAAAVLAAMGPRARPVPLIVFHGAADEVVTLRNGVATLQQWQKAGLEIRGGGTAEAEIAEHDAGDGHGYTATAFRSEPGQLPTEELWMVRELGHAWSGGAEGLPFSDPAAPPAAREMLRFFLQHRLELDPPHNQVP